MNIKKLAILAVAFSFTALADPTYKSVTYYEALGQKFRVEMAQKWPKCKPIKSARKLYLDATNELREIAYWDEQGKMEEGGKDNKPALLEKVNAVFAQTQTEDQNPCLKPSNPGKSSTGVEQ